MLKYFLPFHFHSHCNPHSYCLLKPHAKEEPASQIACVGLQVRNTQGVWPGLEFWDTNKEAGGGIGTSETWTTKIPGYKQRGMGREEGGKREREGEEGGAPGGPEGGREGDTGRKGGAMG